MIEYDEQRERSIKSQHNGMIHGIKLNFYENMFVTYGSDGFLFFYKMIDNKWQQFTSFQAHQSAILCLDWSHPRFGTHLVTGDFSGIIKIHRITSDQINTTKSSQKGNHFTHQIYTIYSSEKCLFPIQSVQFAHHKFSVLVGTPKNILMIFWQVQQQWQFTDYKLQNTDKSWCCIWSPNDEILVGSKKTLKFLGVNYGEKTIYGIEPLFKVKQVDGDIKKMLWSPHPALQFTQLVILSSGKLTFYEFQKKEITHVCEDKVTSKSSEIGWADNYRKVCLYSFQSTVITTKIYQLSVDGGWVINDQEHFE